MLTQFLEKKPSYQVETGYGFSDRFSFPFKTATEAVNGCAGEWIRAIWRGNQQITFDQLLEDVRKEGAARTSQ